MKIIRILFTFFIVIFFAEAKAADSPLLQQLKALQEKYKALDEGTLVPETLKERKNASTLPTNQDVGIPVGEELVLSLYVDNIYLGDIFAEKSSNSAKLGISALLTLIDFPIFFSNDLTSASGWFFEESNTFTLEDKENNITTVLLGDEQQLPKDKYVIREEDDIYIESDVISSWFNLNFEYNFRRLTINLNSSRPLPVQLQLARKSKQTYGELGSVQSTLPLKDNPYKRYTSPVADIQLTVNTNKHDTTSAYSLIGSNDLAYLNAQYSLNGTTDSDGLTDLRLNLSKQSTDADLLGALNATSIEFGDIQSTSIGLNSSTSLSRGIRISNKILSPRSNESNINISGDIQPEWDIELYRNGILIDNQFSLPSNRYEFNDVDLLYGNNLFELIFYGPQGQTLKETRQYYINNDFFEKNGNYDVSLTDKGESLFGVSNTTLQDEESGIELAGVYNRGLTNWLSTYIGGSSLLDKDNSQSTAKNKYTLGADITVFNNILLGLDYIENSNKESTTEYSGRTLLGKQSINLSYRKELSLNLNETVHEIQNNEEIKLSIAGKLPFANSLGYQQSFDQKINNNNTSKTNSISNDINFTVGSSSMSHGLQWEETISEEKSEEKISGSIRSRHTLKGAFIRNQLDYSITPEARAEQFKTEASTAITEDIDIKASYSTQFETKNNEYSISTTWKPDEAVLTNRLLYNDVSGWKVNLIARLSLGQKETNSSNVLFVTKNSLASRGSLLIRVFEDTNINGVFDLGEPTLSGVKVKSVQTYHNAITDEQGIAILTSMQAHTKTDIKIDTATLPDPYLKPLTPGISISPRRGAVASYDFPVVQTSEIEGIVFIGDANGNKFATYVDVQLKNLQGDIVATAMTEYDGYYLFPDVLPGNYTLTVDQDYADKRDLNNAEPRNITFTGESIIISDADFILREKRNMTGFVTQLGTFNSIETLNAFWIMLGEKYPALKTSKTAYYDKIGKELHLYSAFFTSKDRAEKECTRLINSDIQCTVNEKSLN